MSMTPWEKKIFLHLIQKRPVEPDDLRTLIIEYGIEEIEIDHGRWYFYVETIIEFHGKYYSIVWDRGLTELQESEIGSQILEEVKKIKVVKEVEEWVKVNE